MEGNYIVSRPKGASLEMERGGPKPPLEVFRQRRDLAIPFAVFRISREQRWRPNPGI